jgi:hypothetical protein
MTQSNTIIPTAIPRTYRVVNPFCNGRSRSRSNLEFRQYVQTDLSRFGQTKRKARPAFQRSNHEKTVQLSNRSDCRSQTPAIALPSEASDGRIYIVATATPARPRDTGEHDQPIQAMLRFVSPGCNKCKRPWDPAKPIKRRLQPKL